MNMFSCLAWVCFLVQDRSAAHRPTLVYSGVEGEDLTILCPLAGSEAEMFFCKEQCREGDTLIESRSQNAQSTRYSIRHSTGEMAAIQVVITQLMKSDSGRYRCGFGTAASSTLFRQIELTVVDALLDGSRRPLANNKLLATAGSNITVRCKFALSGAQRFFCKEQCSDADVLVNTNRDAEQQGRFSIKYQRFGTSADLYVSITGLMPADSGWYWCGLDKSSLGFGLMVTKGDNDRFASQDAVMLRVAVPLAATGLLLSVAALTLCRRSCCNAEGLWSRGASRGTNTEAPLYENDGARRDDASYLSLHPATRDLDQTYSTLTPTQHT